MNPDSIRYLRLKNSEEIVAYTDESKTEYILTRPLQLLVTNILEEGRQLLNFREYLPPKIVEEQVISLSKKDIMVCMTVTDDFANQYEDMCDYLFDSREKKEKLEQLEEERKENIISLAEALLERKGKPVH